MSISTRPIPARWLTERIGAVLQRRIKLIADGEQTYTGTPSDLMEELGVLFCELEVERNQREI